MQIADHAEVAELEDRCVRVLVDGEEAPVALAGVLNPLPLLLAGKLLNDEAAKCETRPMWGSVSAA